jgi:V8-like Glu-specific endopeptidase
VTKKILLPIACTGLLACQPSVPRFASSKASIIGGATDTGDPSVVALYAQDPTMMSGALCTASVISPTVLLTAAHCVDPAETGANAQFFILEGSDINSAQPSNVNVSNTAFNPMFDTTHPENGYDVGVVVLDRSLGRTPLPFAHTAPTNAMVGQPVRLVGYGLNNETQQAGAGVKRQVTTVLDDFDSLLLHIGDDTHETCSGDSGGPAFMQVAGVETIVGVTSFGNQTCTGGGYDTRIDDYLSWINTYVNTTCTPMCSGRTCGDDGCGGSCGGCGTNQTCSAAGQCVMACVPSCAGRACGDDGCGGSCGGCGTNQTCSMAGQCVSSMPATPCDGNGGFETEPNETSATASAVCSTGRIMGTIGTPTDVDWYSFTVAAEHTYTVTLSDLAADMTLSLFKVLNGNITWLGDAPNNHDLMPQSITRHSPDGGAYYLRIVGDSGRASLGSRYLVQVQ